jgi:hypothetical protein
VPQSYTLADLQLFVQGALCKPVDVQLGTSLQLINDALDMLVHAHPWRWRQRYLSLTASIGSTALSAVPSDFAGIHVLHAGNGLSQNSLQVLEEIPPLRTGQSYKDKPGTYRYLIDTTPQAGVTLLPTTSVRIFPAAKANGTVEGIYLRTIAALAGATDKPDIPAHFHVLLKQIVRAHALMEDNQPEAVPEMELYKSMLDSYKFEDDNAQSNRGATSTSAATAGLSK